MLIANANMDVASIDQSHMVDLSEGEKGMNLKNIVITEKPAITKIKTKINSDRLICRFIYTAPKTTNLSHVNMSKYMFIGIIMHL